ncbi:unnamed protein product [Blepharisma stoltei]|uniref:RRM domain-containing protein n=1 Tax=Blepharisma stoltei TaxID=1481888 RepID=A0AAU9IM74_9CILI|nr:unnamed protein product [Blepharisma stoltei]
MFAPGGLPMAPFRPPSTSYMPRPELPPHLQSLFNPRPPLPFMKVPVKPKCRPLTGIAEYVDLFEEGDAPERSVQVSSQHLKQLEKEASIQKHKENQQEELKKYNPNEYPVDSNAYKTLFVCRLSYETNERKLKREFEVYGPIRSVSLVKDREGKSRGYAFIEYENESDFKTAYKNADGRKIDGRCALVDCERGRTTKDWKPRRLGGGKGNTRATRPKGEKPRPDNIFDESRGYKPHGQEPAKPSSRSRSPRDSRKYENRNRPPQPRYRNNPEKPRRDDYRSREYRSQDYSRDNKS